MKEYNKLVRDKIPEIIVANGGAPQVVITSGEDYIKALKNKLVEEAQELLAAETREQQLEELADVQEVMDALLKALDIRFADVCEAQINKYLEKGSFKQGYFLQKVFEKGDIK